MVVNFIVRGNTGFEEQGGNSGGCGVPKSATAVAASISSTDIGGTGYFRIWPYGQSEPDIPMANYQFGPVTSTGATVKLGINPDAAFDISVTANGSPAGLAMDVFGYYEPQIHLIVLADGTIWYGNNTHLTKFTHTAGTAAYTFVFDRSLAGCSVIADGNGDAYVRTSATWSGSSLSVGTYFSSNGVLTAHDESFQIVISC
jgi:hypothetical protein